MKIAEFQNLIREFPYKNQSFDIKRENWKIETQQEFIDGIFKDSKKITLNRFDLINSSSNIKEFIIKTLMWGYPTKGRGKNIENILEKDNLNKLILILQDYKNQNITITQLNNDIKAISGLGLSTMTKFTHFLNTTIEGNKAVILDLQIIAAINTERFEEFNELKGISYDNGLKKYIDYIKIINSLSKSLNFEPDQIEMFLFTFGQNLSEFKG